VDEDDRLRAGPLLVVMPGELRKLRVWYGKLLVALIDLV